MTFVVRRAEPDDHPVVAELFLSLETGDPPMERARFEGEIAPRTWVAERDGAVVAYLFAQRMGDTVYVRHVATAKESRRSGAARALFARTREEAKSSGATHICLNVKPDNVAAIALYEAEGMRYRYASETHRFAWTDVPGHEVVGVTDAILDPSFDAALEAHYHLPSGQIASTRAIATRLVIGIFRDGAAVGFACFDPGFPGAFPFRVHEPALVPALLHACRSRASKPEMNVVIEDAKDVSAWLAAKGAPPRMSFSHFAGEL